MKTSQPEFALNRRQTLSWAFGLTSGCVLSSLAACGGGDVQSPATADTLPNPQIMSSLNGQLSFDLNAQYASQTMTIADPQGPVYPGKSAKVATALRSFNGKYMAPNWF